MDYRVPLLAAKLYPSNKGLSPSHILTRFVTEPTYKMLYDRLSPSDIILLCLLIGNMEGDNSKIESLYNRIKKDFFVFSVLEITSDETYRDCPECGGNSEVYCHECGGSEEVECPECFGSGENEDGDADCSVCYGEGQVKCEECNSGYELCDYCDGNGEILDEDNKEAEQLYYASFNKKLYNLLETKEEDYDEISSDLMDKIVRSKEVISILRNHGTTDQFSDYEVGDVIFVSVSSEESFSKTQNGIRPTNITPHL
jgi:hypothetical protein